jgi:hypothetical protein
MSAGRLPERQAGAAFAALLLGVAPHPAGAGDSAPQLYELIIETTMPNLEQAIRYATERETRCLGRRDLASAFPILRHDALRGCRLDEKSRDRNGVSYVLVCDGGSGTTGAAHWEIERDRLAGRLDVKLGGKNMTFSQRITAGRRGPCAVGGD